MAPAMALLCACASIPAPAVIDYFDEDSVTAIVRNRTPVTFIARQPRQSALGGDLISLGPLSTILSGQQRQYLWLGFWTTVDRFDEQLPPTAAPAFIVINADDQQIELAATQSPNLLGGNRRAGYAAPAPGTQDAYFEISTTQLRTMADAASVTIRVISPAAHRGHLTFVTRDDVQGSLQAYLDYNR